MAIKKGALDVTAAAIGADVLNNIALGSDLLIETPEPVESELFTTSAAAIGSNESNDKLGWSVGVDITLVSQNIDVQDGSFALKATYGVDGGTTGKRLAYNVTVEIGETYEITYWAKSTGSNSRSYLWTGVSGETTKTFTSTWTQYTETVTANTTTMQMRFFPAVSGTGNIGIEMYVDGISVIKQ